MCSEALDAAFSRWYGDCDFHHNRENVVLLLLEKCDGLSVQDKRFARLLRNAAKAGFEHVVKRLLRSDVAREERGTDTNALGGLYDRALEAASRNGHDSVVQMLLDRGADANNEVLLDIDKHAEEYGSALQAASDAGHAKIVQMLLQNTINTDVGGTRNATAVDIALQWGLANALEPLLKHLCKDTVADEHGWSSEAYLVICRGLTSRSMSQRPMRRYDWPAIPLGQVPSRFTEAIPRTGLSFSDDGLEITASMRLSTARYCNICR